MGAKKSRFGRTTFVRRLVIWCPVVSEKNERLVTLHTGISFADAWEYVLLPWFESIAGLPLTAAPSAVVTPSRSLAYLMRSKLLERGISILGLKFLSPAQLRETLLQSSRNIPLREHLRLLLAIAAEGVAARSKKNQGERESPEFLIAKSIARDPDHFLRAIDQLNAAGWTSQELEEPGLREIAGSFERIAHDCGFEFVHEADRNALAAAAKSSPIFKRLLVAGFNGAHWPLWPLLRAAVTASAQTTVILNDPRDEARDLDEIWIGTWEETFGAAQPIAEAERESVSLLENCAGCPKHSRTRPRARNIRWSRSTSWSGVTPRSKRRRLWLWRQSFCTIQTAIASASCFPAPARWRGSWPGFSSRPGSRITTVSRTSVRAHLTMTPGEPGSSYSRVPV